MKAILSLASILMLAMHSVSPLPAQSAAQDDFQREGRNRQAKDALEGKRPPALQVSNWLHADALPSKGKATLAALKGKVVLLKFWGVW